MKSKAAEVIMESPDGKSQTEVNNNESVGIMEGLGWKVVGDAKPRKAEKKPDTDPEDDKTNKGGESTAPAGKTEVKKTEGPPDYSGMKKDDLKELLDAKGIDYDNHATKADLIELLGTK